MSTDVHTDTPPTASVSSPSGGPVPIKSVPVRRYGQWIAVAVVAVFLADAILTIATNKYISYPSIAKFLFHPQVMHGILVTIQIAFVSIIGGAILGTLVAIGRMSDSWFLRALSGFYIWFFRGVPLLVLVLIWGNFAILFRTLDVKIPLTDVVFLSADTNAVITIFVAACIAIGLHEAAYIAEIVRGGILSVPHGQIEAARALAMTEGQIMRRIILPQAIRTIIPPLGSRVIIALKESSLVSVIAGGELMGAVMDISAVNFLVIELLVVATIWYLVAVTVLSFGQRWLERRFSKGYTR